MRQRSIISSIIVSSLVVTSILGQARKAHAQSPDAPEAPPQEAPQAPLGPSAPTDEQTPQVPQAQSTAPAPAFDANEQAIADRTKAADSALARDGHPLAGYHNGLFYLRDDNDNFHMYIQGRMQLDFYGYAGPGVSNTNLKPTLFIRRIRPEVTGDFLKHFSFMIAGDFGATGLDNPKGTNQVSASSPGAAPSDSSARFAAADATKLSAAATDAFINYHNTSLFNVQVGQFDAPFTLENRTSDKYLQFMERSLAVRAVGIPTNKDIGGMFWGETPDKLWYYSIGLFDGDGQNRPNVDSRGDLYARTFVHPFAKSPEVKGALKDAQIGASFHYGSRDSKWVTYDYPGLTTQGNYTFWTPSYSGAKGNTHILPSGDQLAVAGEIRIPYDKFDLTSEFVWVDNHTREALEGYQATNSERFGAIHGVSYYAQLGYWPLGNRDINGGAPGYENPSRLDWSKSDPAVPKEALQLLVKWEQVALKYDSASRGGTPDAKNIDGNIKANALSFGANYWFTKHVRISLNYVLNMFPDSAPVKATAVGGPAQTSDNRALAPGNTLATGVNDGARDSAHTLHEILARFAIAL
jgi:phosphate-selective porin